MRVYLAGMDHAFSMRAPKTGPPPSPDWSLFKTLSSDLSADPSRYHVLDAVGVRLGVVSGWVRSPLGQVAGLRVAVRGFFNDHLYVIPIGYVAQIDPRHRVLHLREITRRALPQMALRCDGDALPPPEVLENVFQDAPAPRPDILAALVNPEYGPVITLAASEPTCAAELSPPEALPAWRSLAALAEDEDAPYWL